MIKGIFQQSTDTSTITNIVSMPVVVVILMHNETIRLHCYCSLRNFAEICRNGKTSAYRSTLSNRNRLSTAE